MLGHPIFLTRENTIYPSFQTSGPYPQVVLPRGNAYLLEETSPNFIPGKDDVYILERDQTSGIYRLKAQSATKLQISAKYLTAIEAQDIL